MPIRNFGESDYSNYRLLINAHRDLSVTRDTSGEITVFQDLGKGVERYMALSISRDVQTQPRPDVIITITDNTSRHDPVHIKVSQVDQHKVVQLVQTDSGINPDEVIKQVLCGIDIFNASLNINPAVYRTDKDRAYDGLHHFNAELDIASEGGERIQAAVLNALEVTDRLQAQNPTRVDPSAKELCKYFASVLSAPSDSIKQPPAT